MIRTPLRRVLPAIALAAAVIPASAATYVVPSDEDLILKSRAVVRGQVLDLYSLEERGGGILTEIQVRVHRSLKGAGLPSVIVLRQPGGVVGDRMAVFPGIGTFVPGEEVLLMLEQRPDGFLGLADFALGKFRVGVTPEGFEYLRRDGLAEARVLGGVIPLGTHHVDFIEPDRDAARFERFIASVVRGGPAEADYLIEPVADGGGPEGGTFAQFKFLGGTPARWIEFDPNGVIVYRDNATGDAGSRCTNGCHNEVANGVTAWNGAPGAKINLAYGGPDASIGTKCLSSLDNEIQFDDPCNEIGSLISCSGTLALGGFFGQASGGGTRCGNIAFGRIFSAAILINNGTGDCLNSCDYQDMVAHEVGHTIGAGHSDDSTALMADVLRRSRCGQLQSDDVAFAQCVYPGVVPACTGPTVIRAFPKLRARDGIWKAVVRGRGFRKRDQVQIDSGSGFVSAPRTKFRRKSKLLGMDVAAIWPVGVPVEIRVLDRNGCPSNAVSAIR